MKEINERQSFRNSFKTLEDARNVEIIYPKDSLET
jgi:hypothetical protein